MKCNYCNIELKDGAKFCPNCGKEVIEANICIKCGEQIKPGASFCPHCGANQNDIQTELESTEEVENIVEHTQPTVEVAIEQQPATHREPEVENMETSFQYEEASSKKWIWILLPILIIGGIGVWFFMSDGHSTNDNQAMIEAVDSDSIAVIDPEYDIHSIEGIDERLTEIFCDVFGMSDEEAIRNYFSQEYQNLYRKVAEIDNTIDGPGFWNGNIWDGGQDGNPNEAKINSVNSSTDTEAYAEVKLIHREGNYHSENFVSLTLLFENGTWYIDDVDGFKQAMKEYIKREGNASGEGKSNNGTYSMAGKVATYAIHMTIEINDSDVKGYYYYDSQGINNKVKLSGSLKENGQLTLKKFSKDGEETGFFEGVFNGVEYSGINKNYNRDKDLQFSVTVE